MWDSQAWDDMLRWCREDPSFQRDLLIRQKARTSIRQMLSKERLDELTVGQFVRRVATRGCVRRSDGSPVEPDELASISPGQLRQMLEAGAMEVSGNPTLPARELPLQNALPGLGSDMDETLRDALADLLSAPIGTAEAAIASASVDGPLSPQLAGQVRSLCSRRPCGIHDEVRLMGLHRLATLLGIGPAWSGVSESYERFDEVFSELRGASREVLRDPLAADLLLCRLAALRKPKAWKIAIGLNKDTRTEGEAIARVSLKEGFAAIAPDDPDDVNIARLRSLVPGDCVVMHLRGRIGAVGRVTRPYYEIDRADAGPLQRLWWRRVGVEWIAGDRDYGSLLTGAHQRSCVVELDWQLFRAIARMYRRDPRYDRLFRPLHGSWMIRCDDSRFEALTSINKPLPLRDQWTVALGKCRPGPGDIIFLYHDGAPGGVFAAGTVISDPERGGGAESGRMRLEVIYELLTESPTSPAALQSDPRLAEMQSPREHIRHLDPDATAALSELLGVSPRRHFVLLSRGASGNIVRSQETYRVDGQASSASNLLTDTNERDLARCLIYHAAPENAFVGFGNVVDTSRPAGGNTQAYRPGGLEASGGVEVRMEVCRFTRKAGSHSIEGATSGARPAGGGEALTRTILPISEYDFYRVVGAGMSGAQSEDATPSIDALAQEAGAPVARLREMKRLLHEKGQMILYGPPGTGKTWLALRLAGHLSDGDETRQEIVQFHPAYSYEDFIEGIRPQAVEDGAGGTSVHYPLVRGSFASFCDRARRDPANTFVFVIDEINRAQVAAVFGELMLALEYRGREVQLAHARGPGGDAQSLGLVVPHNVLVLATMNTADRSTALVDHALRRRFAFYPLFPDDPELVQPMFENWLRDNAPDAVWVASLLEDLNAWLEPEVGRNLLIGHSYFMRCGLDEALVREIWRFQLRPLLEEYFAGMPERLSDLDIDDLIWRARESAASSAGGQPLAAGIADSRLWWGGSEDA